MLTVNDFVMLGKTVPEPSKKNPDLIRVCSAGYSQTLRKLIRVYPLARYGAPRTWSISTVSLERGDDSRDESYKIVGDRRTASTLDHINSQFNVHGEVPKSQRADLLKRCAFPSIKEAETRMPGYGKDRTSLAIIHPEALSVEFKYNPDSPDSPQLALFDDEKDPPSGAKRFPYIPQVLFRDAVGEHRLSLRDWGTYELMRKNDNFTTMTEGERCRYLAGALHLGPDCSLLVGNQANQRTSWLVIAVLRGLRAAPSLLDLIDEAA